MDKYPHWICLHDPSKCYVISKELKDEAIVSEMSTAVFQAINFEGRECEEPAMSSEIELVSELTGTRTRGSIERTGQSQYKISYQPTIKGRHQLHVKVEGQHIRGSPFTITAKSPAEKLGTPILTIKGVTTPFNVAINQREEVLLTEIDAHCVSVFSSSGKKLRSIGTLGSGEGQFHYPRGIAVDGEGNILITDSANNRIQKFSADFEFLTSVGCSGSGHLQFIRPDGIVCDRKVYVTDNNHRVQVLNSDLTYSSTFGKVGSGKGQFHYPCSIACDSTGNVYVAERGNHRIQVFTAEGNFLRMFGKHGDGKGELYQPTGIAIDSSDMVYVCDSGNGRLSVFTSQGVFVTFGSRGTLPGLFYRPFEWPRGIAVDNSGVLYVCDKDKHCIQLF